MKRINILRVLGTLSLVTFASTLLASHEALIDLGYVSSGQTLEMNALIYHYSAPYTSELINVDTNEVVGSLYVIDDANDQNPGDYYVSGVSGSSDVYRNSPYWENGQHAYWIVYGLPSGNYRLRVSDNSAYSGSSLYNGEILDGSDGSADFAFYTPYGGAYSGSFDYSFQKY